jgi:hypothetical protein
MEESTSARELFKGRHFDHEIIVLCGLNVRSLTGKPATAPELWAAVLAA